MSVGSNTTRLSTVNGSKRITDVGEWTAVHGMLFASTQACEGIDQSRESPRAESRGPILRTAEAAVAEQSGLYR
jgi:hypothetical protein